MKDYISTEQLTEMIHSDDMSQFFDAATDEWLMDVSEFGEILKSTRDYKKAVQVARACYLLGVVAALDGQSIRASNVGLFAIHHVNEVGPTVTTRVDLEVPDEEGVLSFVDKNADFDAAKYLRPAFD